MNPEKEVSSTSSTAQNPQNIGSTLNAATDAVQSVRAFEITIDSLSGDYKDGHFLCLEGPNLDTAMKFREQVAQSMRVYQVKCLKQT